MLDTNTCIVAVTGQPENLLKLLAARRDDGLCISSITLGELKYSEEGRPALANPPGKNRMSLDIFLRAVQVKEFDRRAALEYGKIKRVLKERDSMMKPLSLLVGAHAASLGMTLITDSPRAYAPIPGLRTEDWF